MRIHFQKIHGAGNDFVVFDNRDGAVQLSEAQVRRLCNRHFGIGADGVIEVRLSLREECVAFMHYRNADGSLAEMCGNGVRCFARFLVDEGLLSARERESRSCVVDTLAGPRPLSFELDESGSLTSATVGMGEPVFAPDLIPTTLAATQPDAGLLAQTQDAAGTLAQSQTYLGPAVVQAPLHVGETVYPISCVNFGNPHAVIFLEDVDTTLALAFATDPSSLDLNSIGAPLEGNTEYFPQKTNVELAAVMGNNRIRMRVYERGVGETLACGTGACATAVAAILLKRAQRDEPVFIELSGGTLEVRWLPDNQVSLTGPACTVFTGIIELE
jgi:diaminopimelate epimerase